jgi:hypothetical protein
VASRVCERNGRKVMGKACNILPTRSAAFDGQEP